MNNHELRKLIESLRINLVVFIENDFQPVSDVGAIISGIIGLNSLDRELLDEELREHGQVDLTELIEEFESLFQSLPANPEFLEIFKLGKVAAYLQKVGSDAQGCATCLQKIEKAISELTDDSFQKVLFKYGIGLVSAKYEPIFEELAGFDPPLSKRFYQQLVPADLQSYTNDLVKITGKYGNKNYLCIVDKMLGDDKHEGVRIIDTYFPDISQATGITAISLIFSSQPEDKALEKLQDYYSREIDKNDTELISKIVATLAQCAYAKLFEKLKMIFQASSEEAAELVIKNHKNINHILAKAQEEGLTPFEALYNWFQLAQDFKAHRKIIGDYTNIFKLSEFLDNKYLPSYSLNESIDAELLELNSFEIFDYDVNTKHLPLASGDIFERAGKYYVVVGQECDLLVRERTNTRNAQVIELLEAEFTPSSKLPRKLYFFYDDNTKEIYIQNFKDKNGRRGCLKINLSEYKISNFEFLDLCMFSSNGECTISLNSSLSPDLVSILPKRKDDYYNVLQEKFKSVTEAVAAYPRIIDHVGYIDFSNFNYQTQEQADIIRFEFKRICRVKGNFKYFINKAFFDFRSRVDLNLVQNTEEIYIIQDVRLGLPGDTSEGFKIRIYSVNGKPFIKKDELLHKTPAAYESIVASLDEHIILEQSTAVYELEKRDEGYVLTFKYKIVREEKEEPLSKDKVTFKKLLQTKAVQKTEFVFLDSGERQSMTDADGNYLEFEVAQFKRGIEIEHEGKKHVVLEGNRIVIKKVDPVLAPGRDMKPESDLSKEEQKTNDETKE